MDDTQHATANPPLSMDDAMQNTDNNHDEKHNTPIHDKVTPNENNDTQSNGEKPSAVTASAASMQLQDMADKALHFLSHASNETLGACLVGLAATTYFVLGRIGLVLIGIVGGVALHATWDASHSSPDRLDANEAERKKRKEVGLDVVQRLLLSREKTRQNADMDESDDEIRPLVSTRAADFSSFRPDTQAALNVFTDAIIRDYVKYAFFLVLRCPHSLTDVDASWWYAPVLPGEDSFPSACRQVLVGFIVSLSNHLSRKRPVDTFLDFVTNSSSIVIVFLNELAAALNASPNATPEEAVHAYLDMKPESSLASIMDSKHQEKKLKIVANDILLKYLDNKTYMCGPAQIFLKQVLAKLVLSMTVDSCSKPEFINQWIVYLLEEGEPELMEVIDAGVEGSAVVNSQAAKKQVSVAEQGDKPVSSPEAVREHKRKASRNRAEEAMDEAMREAQRLSQLIAEEEAKKSTTEPSTVSSSGDVSETTTQGIMTPSSSQGDADEGVKSDATKSSPSASASPPRASEDLKKPFTSFDQILPATSPTALSSQEDKLRLKPPPVLTLFKATINIFDDASPGNRTVMRSKPNIDYMIQIEPTSSSFPGWMIVRKYTDFETLHEVLRRISVITGTRFTDSHADLPSWKNNTKSTLRIELERYLNDAVRLQPLAESEGMKRFLDKDGGASRSPGGSKGFGWPTPVAFDQMGKSMIDTLTKAPTQVAGGGKAIFGGVTSILGGKRTSVASNHNASRSSISLNPGAFLEDSYMGSMGNVGVERQSTDSVRSIPAPLSRTPSLSKRVPSVTQPGHKLEQSVDLKTRPSFSTPRTSYQGTRSGELSRPASSAGLSKLDTKLNLPPPPSDIPDDYASPTAVSHQPARISDDMTYSSPDTRSSTSRYPTSGTRSRRTSRSPESLTARTTPAVTPAATKVTKATPPISEQETQVAVELLFAVITELYTLSSAWNIRRTLLNAAKSFLLRPGNPQLEAIRQMIQANVIDTSTSDASIAAHILKIRENSLPTEEELKAWPKEMTAEEKGQLRIKARGLLVERGMPAALTSVMGAAASGEALGRVFDCLQVEGVGRGVVFGVLLQALRAIVQ
ncbi:unnamed protein product [Aureobasidium mustum]|uniref:PXA domain-containing protein n=1 Tax=Aureobasidium mustum TaxID=2773714 RepID=A0A9N8K9M9_9PEZI|nr:unnamed protein product [Aureobasidium mustum]